MENDDIRLRFLAALDRFMADQYELLEMNVNERAVGAVLAHLYVREEFTHHKVDAEYNRIGVNGDPKRLNLPAEFGTKNGRVIPDIIVHRRGDNEENLLVAELKMETNRESRDFDHRKLQAFVEQLEYRVGVFVELPAGPGARERRPDVWWFHA
ncbi:hypothetical protein CN221_27365 [Sinorhizobium meliloti]|uniref:hypothetical protein n=1 Tax=Rhizobium meliloti TaxID=382 RepID=UPI000FE048DE|nr:hypothetical protein [Sinorhizobium meliloti]RVG88457.1 hypothetical protein CN221_27365 [Sinorhizobium meliloti]RVH60020.1 hypothetical protein CN209_25545 [Sinorhizobium meliloti]